MTRGAVAAEAAVKQPLCREQLGSQGTNSGLEMAACTWPLTEARGEFTLRGRAPAHPSLFEVEETT